ncbi:MAG: DUF5674 family protein [Patescibacteria group bacterium]
MQPVEQITLAELTALAERMYGNLVKAVVDLRQGLIVLDMEMHVDGEQWLLEQESRQADLWGINLHPAKFGTDGFIEFDSMINIRPRSGNLSRDVEDTTIQAQIRELVATKVTS